MNLFDSDQCECYEYGMNFKEYLSYEWVPALGCTEPASIAYAGMTAASKLKGLVKSAALKVDPKIYKNCHAVGIPHSEHRTGLKWAAAIGCYLKNLEAKLQCFNDINDEVLKNAENLINKNKIKISVDKNKTNLFVDFTVSDGKSLARTVIEETHTNITSISLNGKAVFKNKSGHKENKQVVARKWAGSLSSEDIIKIAKGISSEERKKIREGAKLNLAIAEHGVALFPHPFFKMVDPGPLTHISGRVCAGVYARMWGEDFPVMSIAGSGNKGIVCSVPLILLEDEWELPPEKVEEALAIAMMFTSKTTWELGTLSAVCGCSNAAGIGLACAIVYLMGGGEKEISFAISNMVGNITGMICDGAKIGCALKTMTSVDAAFRSATLAINGIGIPLQDGIVGKTGSDSLINMGKIAKLGMIKTDEEILKIMEKKL